MKTTTGNDGGISRTRAVQRVRAIGSVLGDGKFSEKLNGRRRRRRRRNGKEIGHATTANHFPFALAPKNATANVNAVEMILNPEHEIVNVNDETTANVNADAMTPNPAHANLTNAHPTLLARKTRARLAMSAKNLLLPALSTPIALVSGTVTLVRS